MKFFAVLLLATLACAIPSARGGISDSVKDKLEALRYEMPNGFPGKGIPPLAPLYIQNKTISFESQNMWANVDVNDLLLEGLDLFEIKKLKINLFSKKLDINLLFPEITINTDYILDMWAKHYNVSVDLKAAGHSYISIVDLDISVAAKVKFSLRTGKVLFKTLTVITSVGDIETNIEGLLGNGKLNRSINRHLSTDVEQMINAHQEDITNAIATHGVVAINEYLKDLSFKDFIGSNSFYNELVELSEE